MFLFKKKSITHWLRLKTPCLLCTQYHPAKAVVCDACEALFTPIGHACKQCATPLSSTFTSHCGACIKHPPALDVVFTSYRFEGALRNLLHQFKYQEALPLRYFFAEKMQTVIPTAIYQNATFVPVPLHPKRIQERGFNQAALLAKRLSKTLERPCALHTVRKKHHTPPQAGLSAKARIQNTRNSFHVHTPIKTPVLLIDDLITTGSTANRIAQTLKQEGTPFVGLWCLAKTCLNQ